MKAKALSKVVAGQVTNTFLAENAANQREHMHHTPVNGAARENVTADIIDQAACNSNKQYPQIPPPEVVPSVMLPGQLELPLFRTCADGGLSLADELRAFTQFGGQTIESALTVPTDAGQQKVPVFTNQFWTSMQRQSNSLQEVPYRASFKPELPRFFIERFSRPGDIILDPFAGRSTVAIESALLGRIPYSNDLNPLSWFLTAPRLHPPKQSEVLERLVQISFEYSGSVREDLLPFFHPATLRQIHALRHYFLARRSVGAFDNVDQWICLVALNRLTGQSDGFFSVTTMPPTFAVSIKAQIRINARKLQVPPERDVREIIITRSNELLADVDAYVRRVLAMSSGREKLLTGPADKMPEIPDNTVDLVVTSPPFLNIVNYAQDNWLRCWFVGIEAASLNLTVTSKLKKWAEAMTSVLSELRRVLKPGGRVAFEVGEVRRGKLKLEEIVLPCGIAAGLVPELIMIHRAKFTKNSHIFDVLNGIKGANTNRIILFKKAD